MGDYLKGKKWGHWIGVVVFVIVVCAGGFYGHKVYRESHPKLLTETQIKNNLGIHLSRQLISSQKNLEKRYTHAEEDSDYTIEHMFVKTNPYKTSPLTALAIFHTDQAARVSYTVVGKTNGTSISNDTTKNSKTHRINVVGLYANTANRVEFTITYADGHVQKKTIMVQTQALPKSLANINIQVKMANKEQMAIGKNGLTVFTRTTKEPFAIDADGQIRWYSTEYNQHIFKTLKNGHLLILRKQNNSQLVYNDLVETNYLGKIYRNYQFSNKTSSTENLKAKHKSDVETTAIHHDVIELPNGNLLATVSDGSKFIEDTMVEINRQTGKVVRVIDLKRIFPMDMYAQYDATKRSDGKVDWLHQNAINYDKKDNSIIISSRHQDLVMKLNYETMRPIWILSGKPKADWPKKWQKHVLRYANGTTINGGQHDARVIPGSQKDGQETISIYDNNYAVSYGDKKTTKKYSAGRELRINLKTMTAKEVWSYGQALGTANFTDRIGSNRLLANGNFLIDFGYLNAKNGDASNIVEVTREGYQVFNVELSNLQSKGYVYRAYRIHIS